MSQPSAVTPLVRRISDGQPVIATNYDTGQVIGGWLPQVAWLIRWVTALGGVAVAYASKDRPDIRITVPAGYVTLHPGEWLVHDGSRFTVVPPDQYGREYGTDLVVDPTVTRSDGEEPR